MCKLKIVNFLLRIKINVFSYDLCSPENSFLSMRKLSDKFIVKKFEILI